KARTCTCTITLSDDPPVHSVLPNHASTRFRSFLDRSEVRSLFALLIVRIERIAARDKSVARGCGAVAESAAQAFNLETAVIRIDQAAGKLRIRKSHPPQPHDIHPPLADQRLGNMGEILLQIGIG